MRVSSQESSTRDLLGGQTTQADHPQQFAVLRMLGAAVSGLALLAPLVGLVCAWR